MLLKEVITDFTENCKELTNSLYDQNAGIYYVKAGVRATNNQWDLKGYNSEARKK
jgi:hypothetical protein